MHFPRERLKFLFLFPPTNEDGADGVNVLRVDPLESEWRGI